MSFLIVVLVLILVMRLVGDACTLSGRRLSGPRRHMRLHREGERHRLAARAQPVRQETPLESLQRRFAAGTIGIEEYEREVGKLYGLD